MTGPPGNDDASDAFAAWIFNGGEVHAEIENLAGCSTYPVLDCEREYTDHVIEDFGVIKAHHEPTDEFRALPVRITYGSLTDTKSNSASTTLALGRSTCCAAP